MSKRPEKPAAEGVARKSPRVGDRASPGADLLAWLLFFIVGGAGGGVLYLVATSMNF